MKLGAKAHMWVPLFWYLLVALGIPWLNGSSIELEHVIWVSCVPVALCLMRVACLQISPWIKSKMRLPLRSPAKSKLLSCVRPPNSRNLNPSRSKASMPVETLNG